MNFTAMEHDPFYKVKTIKNKFVRTSTPTVDF